MVPSYPLLHQQSAAEVNPIEADVVAAVFVLSGQVKQLLIDVLDVDGLYVPWMQPTQSVLPVLFLYCPAPHAKHTKGAGPEYP